MTREEFVERFRACLLKLGYSLREKQSSTGSTYFMVTRSDAACVIRISDHMPCKNHHDFYFFLDDCPIQSAKTVYEFLTTRKRYKIKRRQRRSKVEE